MTKHNEITVELRRLATILREQRRDLPWQRAIDAMESGADEIARLRAVLTRVRHAKDLAEAAHIAYHATIADPALAGGAEQKRNPYIGSRLEDFLREEGVHPDQERAESPASESLTIDVPCIMCGNATNSLAGNPDYWPVFVSPPDADGRTECHCMACVRDALYPERPSDQPAAEPASVARPRIELNGYQAAQLVEFCGGDLGVALALGEFDADTCRETDEPMPAGLYVWCAEYPEEGRVYLDPEQRAANQPAAPGWDANGSPVES